MKHRTCSNGKGRGAARHGWRDWLLAACIPLAAGLLALLNLSQTGIYATATGEQRSIALADGSTVQLNSRSRIRVRFSEEQRMVDLLEGQALFSVAKDVQRPFIVRSGDVRARAVGTQFDVYRKKSETIVTVVEGRVAVRRAGELMSDVPGAVPARDSMTAHGKAADAQADDSILLTAGEQVTVARQVSQPMQADVGSALAWTERKLVFTSTPLSIVIEEFNRYSEARLVTGDNVEDIPITAVFSTTNPRTFIEFLDQQPEFEVRTASNTIYIESALH